MNQRIELRQAFVLLLGLLLVSVIAVLAVNGGTLPAISMGLDLSAGASDTADVEAFDYEAAANVSALRWQAMARYYEAQGLLTRDNFDYERVAEDVAYRWNAMADFYKRYGLLNYGSNPDDVMAYRWLAMADAYKRDGLLNYGANPDDVMAYRWLAMARAYERMGLLNDK